MSLSKKTVKWLSKNACISLNNKTILITGANSGVGYKTTEVWLYLGANIIMACRNMDKVNQARKVMLKHLKNKALKKVIVGGKELISFTYDELKKRGIVLWYI